MLPLPANYLMSVLQPDNQTLVTQNSSEHIMGSRQRRLVTLFHARRCANHAIHGHFNPVQPAESADHNLRTSKTIRTDVIRNVRLVIIQ